MKTKPQLRAMTASHNTNNFTDACWSHLTDEELQARLEQALHEACSLLASEHGIESCATDVAATSTLVH